jgi:hypothetical protein
MIIAAFLAPALCFAVSPAYDSRARLEDLDQTRAAFAAKYANLEWAVFEREADLPALFADARSHIESAVSAAEAQAAFDRLARRLGDAHVRFRWSNPEAGAAPKIPNANCAALGYDASVQGAPLSALVRGYLPLTGASAAEFPAGTIQVSGRKLGVLKIGVFSPQGFPELCQAALSALAIGPAASCSEACSERIEAWVSERITRDLGARLKQMKAAKAEVLLVDLAGNGGGTEREEAAVRMMTPLRLRSHSVGFVRGPHWAKEFSDTEAALRAAARKGTREDRKFLLALADQAANRRHEANTSCDSEPLWRGSGLTALG